MEMSFPVRRRRELRMKRSIHSWHKCVLSVFHTPGSCPGTFIPSVNKTDMQSLPLRSSGSTEIGRGSYRQWLTLLEEMLWVSLCVISEKSGKPRLHSDTAMAFGETTARHQRQSHQEARNSGANFEQRYLVPALTAHTCTELSRLPRAFHIHCFLQSSP